MTGRVIKLLLHIISFLLISIYAVYAGEVATFYRYSSKDGLSCNYVHDIVQDKDGFLWIATEYGLNRFDGVHFRNYFVEDCPSLERNQLMHLYCTSKGNLVVGGNNGVLISYDEKTDSFKNLIPDDFKTSYYKGITSFYTDDTQCDWVTTTNGIYYYNEQKGKYDKYPYLTDSTLSFFSSGMMKDAFGRYLCGTYTGLLVYDEKGNHIKEYDDCLSVGMMISSIITVEKNKYLVASFVGGLWLITEEDNGNIKKAELLEAPFINVNSVIKDSKNNFWFGAAGSGLWKATYDGKFHYQKIEPQNIKSEELKKIHCLYEDRNGDIWIGTQNAGLLRYSTARNSGSVHSSDIGFPLVDGTSFAQDDDGNLLVGADGHGVFLLSPDFNVLRNFTIEDGLSSNNVLSIKKGLDGEFWIASWGGEMCKLNVKTGQITKVSFSPIVIPYITCKSVLPMPNGEVWVAMAGDGVYTMNKSGEWSRKWLQNDTFNIPDIWIEDIAYSKQGVRWVVSSRSVWHCDENGDKPVFPDIDKQKGHRPLMMSQGVCDETGNLYVVTDQGVLRFESDGSSYEKLKYLPEGQYSSIIMDSDGIFWTGGSNGVLSFDDKTKTYKKVLLDERFRSRNYFTCRAAFIDAKGRLYFGNTEGFVMFDPKYLSVCDSVDYLQFAQLFVKGKKQEIGSSYMPQRLADLQKLKLNYDETNISIMVDVIDFSGLNDVEVFYRLRNLDKDWIDLQEKREIKISYIPPGNYCLEVKAKKRGALEDSKMIQLSVQVSPPWWNTWWFYSLIVLSIALIIYMIIHFRFKRIKEQRELLRKMVMERTQKLNETNLLLEQKQQVIEQRNSDLEQALQEKDRLLSVIAHDLKNPMFAIVGALDSVLKNHESMENTWKVLKDIYSSASNLQSAMVKLLEWARGKQTEVVCNMQDASVRQMTQEVLSLLNALFVDKKIQVSMTCNVTHCAMMDARMIGTALRNVLSNAVKFTSEGGRIDIDVNETENGILMKIQDTGVGMTEEQLHSIRNNENVISTMGTKMEKGTGLGFKMAKDFVEKSGGKLSVDSVLGKGTCVTIQLLLSKELEALEPSQEENIEEQFEINADLLQGNTVMIVDDDPLILLHLRTILSPYFRVIEAPNGIVALNLAQKEIPDVILSDVEMPECDGIKMYEQLKQIDLTKNIPLLFLSAKNTGKDRLLGLYKGAIDYISKPFYDKELLMKLTNILLLRRETQQKILRQNFEQEKVEQSSDVNPLLKSLLDLVADNYYNPDFSLEDMCSNLAMSKSTFSRKLKSITDKTPIEILTEYRLHKAQNLLKDASKSVTEVAYMVGFNDPLYFSKKYKSYFGVSPSMEK
ncbi:MAG: response regulator [Paludibacteraceae bacterium]|nr:response regulator [Paludibacteraceae bacterium]